MPIRVLIVDDHHVVRAGLRTFLERDQELEVVDEASNGAEAIEKARYWLPNVVLMCSRTAASASSATRTESVRM